MVVHNIHTEKFCRFELERGIHFPKRRDHAIDWPLYATDWWGGNRLDKYDHENLSGYTDKLTAVLADIFNIKEDDKVFLYSGGRDWNLLGIKEHANILAPVIKALWNINANPILLTCFCNCYEFEKRRLAKMFNITLGYEKFCARNCR